MASVTTLPAASGLRSAASLTRRPGAVAAFATNALLYLPLLIVLFLWRRVKEPLRLPPERMARAVISGVRYIVHSPPIRIVLGRTLCYRNCRRFRPALMPIVTRDLLHGGAQTYGVMLGTFGMGAVIGALKDLRASRAFGRRSFDPSVHDRYGRLCRCRGDQPLASPNRYCARLRRRRLDRCSTCCSAVGRRSRFAYQPAIPGGIAPGSGRAWGSIANVVGVEGALLIWGATLFASPVLGLWIRMPTVSGPNELSLDVLADPEVRLSLTPRSGPIVIEIEYRVDPAKARLFYAVMQHVQLSRQRNGAYGWSIARDIADPELWTERFHCPDLGTRFGRAKSDMAAARQRRV